MRIGTLFSAILAFGIMAGCASEQAETESAEKPVPEAMESAPSEETSSVEITEGMSMSDVKKLKGAPKDAVHEHGPAGEEIDIWKYEDGDIKFSNGKVSQ